MTLIGTTSRRDSTHNHLAVIHRPKYLLTPKIPPMTVTIHVLDVSSENGYGDSTLISAESFDKRIDLIFDASYSKNLKKCNLSDNKFRYAFLTHYHEDHYGGFTDLLKNNQIRTFYMPDAL